jgi:hypothetical protein
MKWISKLLIFVLSALIALLSFNLLSNLSILDRIGAILGIKSVTEQETVIIIEEVRNIAQLLTQKYYDEIFFDSGIIVGRFLQRDKRIAVIAEGYVKAGFDLSSLDENALKMENGIAILKVPAPKIMSVVSNPSNQEVFIARGFISQDEQNHINGIIKETLKENAVRAGILERSAKQGRAVLIKLLSLFGFDNVRIEMEKPESQLRGEALIEKIFKKAYSGYGSIKSETLTMDINFENNASARAVKLRKETQDTGRSVITCAGADGGILCEVESFKGSVKTLRGGIEDPSVRQIVDFAKALDFYGMFRNRASYIFHFIRTVDLGSHFDVVLAFPGGKDWIKIYVNRKTGFIELMDWPLEFNGRKVVARSFFSDYRRLGGGPMLVPLRCVTYVDNKKIFTVSVTNAGYDAPLHNL